MGRAKINKIYFASSNSNKYREIEPILSKYGIVSHFVRISIQEIQSESLYKIAKAKSTSAFEYLKGPVIIEDDGFYISSLKGFPGQYSSFIYKTLGNEGLLKLMKNKTNRKAYFVSVIAYNDGHTLKLFTGKTQGLLNRSATNGGWGFDPIFVPKNTSKTYGELSQVNRKSLFSHRYKSIGKFSKWYMNTASSL
ncbi:MAG: RdgB/HAM1 family non-canonical purine NTP pyrophosphatase [Nitrososphaeraceae archaeon]